MASSGWVIEVSSEEPPPPSGEAAEVTTPPLAAPEEKPVEPGEEWIEEYESEKKEKPKRRKVPHAFGIAVTVAILLILVVWTLLSPQVLQESGGSYLDSQTYANLGSYDGELDIRVLFETIYVADTVWGVSVSGDSNVSSGQPTAVRVLVTKVHESMKNPWFVGTSVDLKKVDMFIEGGDRVGTTVSETSEPFGPVAELEVTFDSPGTYECYVYVEMTIYCKMLIGYLPVKVVRISADLDVDIVVS
jgi:hypothetical protein